ncbi:lysophospholipid acyltransferase family protein [Sporohalobacter salinus]|uniref:lysophospholipid acyltransferase family protein n=1 Tax=Sporohalobacter salinus TaxID=1494606 RepID=UPI00195F9E57|nr:lysophospholipid acyltransferase family protein [Sporohalobacter salinus]MBM7622929.1 lysophospholipid acyltransferase (LPLAT)-like uncharacterized protein [Sporohalobacter salinus]
MKRIKTYLIYLVALILVTVTNLTLRLQVTGEKKVKRLKQQGKNLIFAFWHGKMLVPIYYLRHRGYYGLASRSRDGEYISRVLKKLGWNVVRGSTSRGSVRALLKLIKVLKQGEDVAITPDGPRGPRHTTKAGAVYLAKKSSDSLIIPIGVAFTNKKVINSWDRFNLPYPFTKGSLFFGDPIEVSSDADEDQIETKRKQVDNALKTAFKKAEQSLN